VNLDPGLRDGEAGVSLMREKIAFLRDKKFQKILFLQNYTYTIILDKKNIR
jgi:hypothetical protein